MRIMCLPWQCLLSCHVRPLLFLYAIHVFWHMLSRAKSGPCFVDAPAMDVAHYHGDGTIITRCHLRGFEGWCLAHPPTPVLTLNKPSPCNVSRYRLWSQPATWAEGFGGCASVLIPICLEFHTRISCVTSNYLEGLHPSSSRPLWIWCA